MPAPTPTTGEEKTLSFYVKRSRPARPGYQGWTGPIQTHNQAQKEAQAWREAGWDAEVLPSSPEVKTMVKAWERLTKMQRMYRPDSAERR